ncbi:MAG: hypothetical protein QOF51_4329 [Chloroflexota bacterium]|jgi:lipopolysaccharide heptosyltransferase II|nr:hypothetical protein [Chloroflexota bacterium]
MSRTDWALAERILCVRLDSLGDVLMTSPALRALKASQPSRWLSLLTSEAGGDVARLIPEIDEVIVYNAPWLKATVPRRDSRAEYAMAERLRQGCFDAAVIFTVYSQHPLASAMLCYLADVPLRLAHCHENPYQLLTDWVPDPDPSQLVRHEVQRQLDLVAAVGCVTADERLSLRIPDAAHEAVQHLLAEVGISRATPWIVLHPGASAPSRRYPAAQFAAVGRELVVDGFQVAVTGSAGEYALVEEVRDGIGPGAIGLAGRLTLPELAALIAQARLLVANNTGPVHVAAAVGTPVVDLYALTNPQHTPWLVPHRTLSSDVPCRWCYKSVCPEGHHHCLRLIPPATVAAAVRDLLDETSAPRVVPALASPAAPLSSG